MLFIRFGSSGQGILGTYKFETGASVIQVWEKG
jgi:hypothetical protein